MSNVIRLYYLFIIFNTLTPREKLRQYLTDKGISNSEFAEKLNKPRQYVTNILNGTKGFGLEFVLHLSKCYPDIDLNWLIKETDISYNTTPTHTTNVNEAGATYTAASSCKYCQQKEHIILMLQHLSTTQQKTISSLNKIIETISNNHEGINRNT